MKKQALAVHALVRSMNEREKRFFYLSLARESKGYLDSFMVLFDALRAQEEYQENEVMAQIDDPEFLVKYPSRLEALHHLTIGSLVDLHSTKKLTSMLKYSINEAEVLFDRGLYEQSKEKLNEAREIASTFENYSYNLEILALEKRLWRYLTDPLTSDAREMNRIYLEEQEITSNRNLEFQLSSYRDKLRSIKEMEGRLRTEESVEEVNALMEMMDGIEVRQLKTFWQKLAYHELHAVHAQLTGDINTAFHCWEKCIIEWHLDTMKVNTFRDEYSRMLAEFMLCALVYRKNLDFLSLMVRLKTQQGEFAHDKQHMELLLNVLKLGFHLYKGNLHYCEQLVPAMEEGLSKQGAKLMDPYYELQLWHQLQVVYFLMGQYEEAYQWGERIMEYRQSEYGLDIQDFARMINLLVLYEQARLDEIGEAVKVFEEYLMQEGRFTEFEGLVFELCATMAGAESEEEERAALETFKDRLLALRAVGLHTYSMEYNVLLAYVHMRLKASDIGTEYYYVIKSSPDQPRAEAPNI